MAQNNKRPDNIGQRLKEEREYRGFSEQEIAEYLGISETKIKEIEEGQRNISSNKLGMLAELYKLSATQLRDNPRSKSSNAELDLLARRASDLSERDRAEIQRFAEFLNLKQNSGDSSE